MTHKPTSSGRAGFTLLEMTVIIGIMGILIGSFVSFYKPTQTALGMAKSRQQVDRVLNALSSFALLNNRLPCPASPTENNPANIGREDGGACGNLFTPGMGILPYRALGMSIEDVQDGFERYMTYIVYQPATIAIPAVTPPADSLLSLFCLAIPPNAISILRSGINETNNAFVAVIAHGPDGVGGYNMTSTNAGARGTPIPDVANMGMFERENAVDFGSNRVDIAPYSQQEGNNHFDDTVGYMTGFGVISRLGVTYCR